MSIEIKELSYENYGNCIRVSNNIIDAVVTVECGPRIVHFGFHDCRNVMYNDLSRKYVTRSAALDEYYGRGSAFFCYGGHRLWLAPKRIPQTYCPDNGPVVYSIQNKGVVFTPPYQKKNGLQTHMEIIMVEGTSDMMVIHSVENQSKERQRLALWGITMLTSGGTAVVPQNLDGGNPLFPNRFLSLWPYSSFQDKRFFAGDRYITLRQNSEIKTPFKLGTNNIQGWAAYMAEDFTFIKRYIHTAHAPYPDNNCSFEAYVNEDYLELESMSPLYTIEPGEAIRHVENFALFHSACPPQPTDEEGLKQYFTSML